MSNVFLSVNHKSIELNVILKAIKIKSLTLSRKSFPQSHRPCAVIDF